jgi:hypothetical protein
MKGINVKRWLLGGIAAGIVMWLLEGVASMFYIADMEAAMQAHNLSMEMSGGMILMTVLVSLISGWILVFLYAAVRPRFGPGPKTAVIAALALWIGGYLLSLIGYHMMGLFPAGLLVLWGFVALVEIVIAALVGGMIYKEN